MFCDTSVPVGIVDAAYHLPGDRKDVVEWAADQDVSPELIEKLLDSGCRHFYAAENESDLDLVTAAVERLEDQAGRFTIASAAYVVHAHTQNFSVPAAPVSLLAEVANRHGMRPRLCFSVEQMACSGIVAAIDWATRLLAADLDAEYALVLSSDRVFGNASYRLLQQSCIQSDGASAILLGKRETSCGIGPTTYLNFPELRQGPSTPANEAAIARSSWLHTRRLLQEHEEATGLAVTDHGQILPINAYRANWDVIGRSLSIPPDRWFLDNIRNRGHACCADFAINLVDRGFEILKQGKPVLYCGRSNVGAYAALTLLPTVMAKPHDRSGREMAACEVVR
jgi:3-oxoacyl-[acyl-carrier-protein] synthase III